MAKISVNLPDILEKEIREFAKQEDKNLTATIVLLLRIGLKHNNKTEKTEKDYKDLLEKYKTLEQNFEAERREKTDILKSYQEFNTQLLELMRADRILQVQSKKNKPNLFKRVKIFFLGDKKEE